MRKKITWNQFVILLVQSFFVLIGLEVIVSGNYVFGFIWLLLTGTTLYRTLQGIFSFSRRGTNASFSFTDHEGDVDVYGHRTKASYEKERLYKLEELYQSRLISKEEYEGKRKEIIKQL